MRRFYKFYKEEGNRSKTFAIFIVNCIWNWHCRNTIINASKEFFFCWRLRLKYKLNNIIHLTRLTVSLRYNYFYTDTYSLKLRTSFSYAYLLLHHFQKTNTFWFIHYADLYVKLCGLKTKKLYFTGRNYTIIDISPENSQLRVFNRQ